MKIMQWEKCCRKLKSYCRLSKFAVVHFFFYCIMQLEKSSKKLMIAIGGVTAQVVIDIMFCVKTWSKNR